MPKLVKETDLADPRYQRALPVVLFARVHGVHPNTVLEGIKSGVLRTVTVNKQRLVLIPRPDPVGKLSPTSKAKRFGVTEPADVSAADDSGEEFGAVA